MNKGIKDGSLNYAGYAALIGVSEATIKRRLNELKKEGAIVPQAFQFSIYFE
ncbi:MAG: winged helix-turn-helix transcriptional regulator [Bacteroidales bacterium]|nr:winged helix-turn-helix transcriptional regulator [Bacteroidales bacterium]